MGAATGTWRSTATPGPDERTGTQYRFRLALADEEGLDRTQRYLEQFGVPHDRFAFSAATEFRRAVAAIRTSKAASFARITELVDWPSRAVRSVAPRLPGRDLRRGGQPQRRRSAA